MDMAYNLRFLIICVYIFCHLPTSEAGCGERPACNGTHKCENGLVCLDSKCYKYKCRRPEQAYLISKNEVGCDCTESEFTGNHCECPMTPKPTSPPKCESGWHIFERSCYSLPKAYLDWNQAKKYCEDENAHLATVESKDEHEFIGKQVSGLPPTWYWIGAKYDDTDKTFKWLNGDSVELDFKDPSPLSLDNGCMYYDGSKNLKLWYTFFCGAEGIRLICEKQAE